MILSEQPYVHGERLTKQGFDLRWLTAPGLHQEKREYA